MSNNILTTSLILIFCFSTYSSASSAEDKPAKPRPKITISKETTFITEPLDADGYPDYVAALNQHCSRGVTPENNAAVLFWKAVGPAEIKPERREQYFKMLGMAPLPDKGDYFRSSGKQVDLHKTPQNNTDEYILDPLYDELNTVTSRLWSQEEFPVWTNWLEVNEKPMALIAEASKRPWRYDPWFPSEKYKHAISSHFITNEYRDVARAFHARALLRAHQGKINEAWKDIMVIHHLARLVGQGPKYVDLLVAITIDSMAYAGERAILSQAKISAVTIASMQKDFQSLPPLSDVNNCSCYGERLFALSIIVDLSSYSAADWKKFLISLETFGVLDESQASSKPLLDAIGDAEIDWDTVLGMVNVMYNRYAKAWQAPCYKERLKALSKIDEDFPKNESSLEDHSFLKKLPKTELNKISTQLIGQTLLEYLCPTTTALCGAVERNKVRFDLTELSFALAQYKADHRSFPNKLDELKPKYIDAIPLDHFNNGTALIYERKKDGYLLYSVGPNGRDDGGKIVPCDNNCDDIAVRVPIPNK